jgi:IclR family transcriptional regulator, KDG regulon repressor
MRGQELMAAPPARGGGALPEPSWALAERSPWADSHPRTAVDKAFELLAAFPAGGATVGVTELARDLQLSKSTVFRLLGAMERNGMVERMGNRYRLGRLVYDIGARVYEARPGHLLELLMPTMTSLYEESRETVSLGVLRDGEVLVLGRLHGSRPTPPTLRPGSRSPAHRSALGRVLLAYSSDAADELQPSGPGPRTARTLGRTGDLREELGQIRERGIALSVDEGLAHLTCVALALVDQADRAVAALAISAPSSRFDVARHELLLRRAAAGAQRALRQDPVSAERSIPVSTGPSPQRCAEGGRF